MAESVAPRAREGAKVVRSWRLMCRLQRGGKVGRLLARLMRNHIHRAYGCHISPESDIRGWINLPHPVGIVIGHGVSIEADATIYQNVTLGRKAGTEGYPVVATGAVLYPGCVVTGAISIGRGAIVGANSVVLHDVPPGCMAAGAPARIIIAHGGTT